MVAIGIDLGTTYSCVSVWRNGYTEVILNEHGNRTTPSYVAFTATERLIGETARSQAPFNPRNTIFGIKRIIGRRYNDIGLQTKLHHWPFKIIDENGKPMILVKYRDVLRKFAAEEISSMIIYKMKEIAELHLGKKVDKAVITVPAYFNDAQRQATRAAGTIAGLEVLRVTNEPTAAVLAYGIDRQFVRVRNVLMYDLGGGTFDVSIVSIQSGSIYKVKATAGNTRLGGEDFDNRLVTYFVEDFKSRKNIDLNSNAKAVRRLKRASEIAKCTLSTANEATVVLESLCDGIDYRGRVTRAFFEELCSDLFQDTLMHVIKALLDAQMTVNDIQDVLLVGGSTRIPKIRSLLTEFFGGHTLLSCLNPDESIACGAAVLAAKLCGDDHEKIRHISLKDVVPLSLGVETARGIMYKVINRNTTVPCRRTKDLTTLDDYQMSMTIEVYEGERMLTKDNNLLGVFDLNGIPPAPRGVPKIDITFDVDANGILTVTAKDRSTGATEGLVIRNEHRLSQQEITRMITDAQVFKDEDLEQRMRLEARNQLESYVYGVRQTVNEDNNIISDKERDIIRIGCQEVIVWLDNNEGCSREDYEAKMTELMNEWSEIMNKFYDTSWTHNKRMRGESYRELEELHIRLNESDNQNITDA